MMTLNAAHLLGVEAEQLGGEDQMAGRGDRQELGDALDDAEDDRDQQDWHRRASSSVVAVKMNSAAGELAALWKRPSHSSPTAASGVGWIPNASRPGARRRRHIVVLEHQPLVAGQRRAGQQAERDSSVAERSRASATRSGVWPVISRIARCSSTIVIICGPPIS